MLIQKNKIIRVGNYLIHVGTYKTTDIAIFSKNTHEVIKFRNIRKGSKLAKIKRDYKIYLSSTDSFYFSFMQEDTLEALIKDLKI